MPDIRGLRRNCGIKMMLGVSCYQGCFKYRTPLNRKHAAAAHGSGLFAASWHCAVMLMSMLCMSSVTGDVKRGIVSVRETMLPYSTAAP